MHLAERLVYGSDGGGLTGEILVLPSERLHGVMHLLDLSSQLIDLGGISSRFLLRVLQFALQVGYLSLPLVDRLVEGTLALLCLGRDSLSLFLDINQ